MTLVCRKDPEERRPTLSDCAMAAYAGMDLAVREMYLPQPGCLYQNA